MGDVISRQDTINELKNVFDDILCCNVSVRKGLPEAVRRIEMLPSAKPKHGGWIYKNGLRQFFCSECGYSSLTHDDVYIYGMDLPNYCSNCGSFNGGGEEDETNRC